ncbi:MULTISPECIES: hypothetical protein [unclassified Leifsonia]|uniref:hypothetical protein n=1 Tax=unclassified Leifsonia TaxID=2663824 RepID=UPI0008A81323|nr:MULTISPECIES: hypothetical protein [unclassified Leifsonia]SEI17695.1 hypothetical protein SAMN04515694_1312 [Leifsonia sp. CL154]SFM11036.1 hypothetical protein SAMN04515692_1303 [Leifsonia sp. CL147]
MSVSAVLWATLGPVGLFLVVTGIANYMSIRWNNQRKAALRVTQADSLILTGLFGFESHRVIRALAAVQGLKPKMSFGRFSVSVDSINVCLFEGRRVPRLILTIPLSTIREVHDGKTYNSNGSYPTIFLAVDADGTTYDLQLRVAGERGILYPNGDTVRGWTERLAKAVRLAKEASP